jgi:hypothetical protein
MLKIYASINNRVPIPGQDYSSQSFGAGIEVELADGATGEQIQMEIAEVYSSLHEAIERQISGGSAFGSKVEDFTPPVDDQPKESAPPQQPKAPPAPAPASDNNGQQAPASGNSGTGGQQSGNTNGNGNGQKNGSAASDKQIGLIVNLAKDVNVSRSDLNGACQKLFNADLDHISKLNASSLIGDLQKVRDGKINVASIFGNKPAKAA